MDIITAQVYRCTQHTPHAHFIVATPHTPLASQNATHPLTHSPPAPLAPIAAEVTPQHVDRLHAPAVMARRRPCVCHARSTLSLAGARWGPLGTRWGPGRGRVYWRLQMQLGERVRGRPGGLVAEARVYGVSLYACLPARPWGPAMVTDSGKAGWACWPNFVLLRSLLRGGQRLRLVDVAEGVSVRRCMAEVLLSSAGPLKKRSFSPPSLPPPPLSLPACSTTGRPLGADLPAELTSLLSLLLPSHCILLS